MTSHGLEAVPAHVRPLCAAFLSGLQQTLGDNLAGVYLYGAMTFPDSQDTVGDVDYHVFLRRPVSSNEKEAVIALRPDLERDFPGLAGELDGYYILLEDARHPFPPRHQLSPPSEVTHDHAWALHCAHVRAGRCIVLLGPEPAAVYPEPPADEIDRALAHEMDFVRAHLNDAPAYCVLNLCRLLYSHETGDVVVSKRGAAEWARGVLPQWAFLIDVAQRFYAGTATPEDADVLKEGVHPFRDAISPRLPW